MVTYTLGQAAQLELLLKNRGADSSSPLLSKVDLSALSAIGCPFALALQSDWVVQNSVSIANEYGESAGTGRRRYFCEVKMLVPTEIDHQFTFSFHAELLVDFSCRRAILSTSIFRFCGEPYRFGGLHEYKETIYDYMYVIGCSTSALTTWVNADEKALHKIRRWWLKDFAPARIAQANM